ncbi:MAG TPA: FGGY family carbohydrate kinase [Candidatus Polarisedimenticolia bacterium]|nr:FGGY family carbohydrate kinase [Candidatus Polarisedimenticolia bacterium]
MPAGLDLGSSSIKAILVRRDGRDGRAARRGIATRRRPGGRVEHDAEEVLAAAMASLHAVLPGRGGEPETLGIATQRSTVLFWDRDSGRPLTPAYSWQDLRGAALCDRLRGASRRGPAGPGRGALEEAVRERTGLRLSPHYAAAKLAWALRHVRGLGRRVAAGRALWGTLGTFLAWRMSGGAVYAIDHANAQRTLLFDLASQAWEPGLFETFGLAPLLDAPALPALVPTSFANGARLEAAGRPVRLGAMTGDQQGALIGLGCRDDGSIAINYGSGAFVLIGTGARLARVPGLLTTMVASWRGTAAAGSRSEARYAVEGTVNAAGTAIDWAAARLRLRLRASDLDRQLGKDPGRERTVHFLPAVSGLGAPRWDPAARPRFAGDVKRASTRDLLRAVVESIACRCAEIVRAAPRHQGKGPVLAAGGLTRCRTLLQAQADLLQRPVIVRESPDAGCLGAALLTRSPSSWWPGARGTGSPRRRPGDVIVRPRLSRAEAEERYVAWERAVYGRAASR